MKIRSFQSGDEATQVDIYNEAAASWPRFKPATVHEVQRRTSARDFDPNMRWFVVDGNREVGYCLFNANGRVSYPWCRPGFESCAEPLFQHVLTTMQQSGQRQAFSAYRHDWPAVCDFFLQHGFHKARDMVNYVQETVDVPTVPARPSSSVTPLERADVPAVFQLCPEALRVATPEQLEEHLFDNPYFGSDCLFVLRGRVTAEPLAVGLLITEPTYADPALLDPMAPCFRLGAFGSEFRQTKRVKGLFSILARNDRQFPQLALDLLGQAIVRIQDCDDIGTLAAQVATDVPHLHGFYQRNFRQQGSFPVFERELKSK